MLSVDRIDVVRGAVPVLSGVSLEVNQGEAVAIIGANGAGKTTLLTTIAGLLKPAAGNIVFAGQEIQGVRPDIIARRGLRLVPENRQLFNGITVEDNLRLGATGMPGALVSERLEWTYTQFPILAQRRKQRAGTLSGGQQQMAAIGRAVISEPDLLMLDEPSTGLAPRVVEEVFAMLSKLREGGTTVLLVEQLATAALAFSDRAYVLELGRVTLEGPAAQLAADARVEAAYLGGTLGAPGAVGEN